MATRCFFASILLLCSVFFAVDSGEAHPFADPQWHPATATWYGSPDGDGSDGDDPKEVKARLKVWAQAVALASTSHLN